MRHAASCLLVAVVLAGTATAAVAQAPPEPGQRVRIVAPEFGVTTPTAGTVRALDRDTLVLTMGRGSGDLAGIEMRIPTSAILQLETSRGMRNRVGTAAVGLAGGTVLGFASARAHRRFSTDCGARCGMTGRGARAYDTSMTGKIIGAGAVIGVVTAAVLPGERWEVSRGVGVVATGGGGGSSLGLSLRF